MTPWVSSGSSLCSHFCTMQRSLNFHWLQLHNATVQDYTFCALPLTHTKHKINMLNLLTQLYVRIDMASCLRHEVDNRWLFWAQVPLYSRNICIPYEAWMQNLDRKWREESLTDYSLWRNAHDVTAFGEEQMQIFHWTVATPFCFRVIRKWRKSLSVFFFFSNRQCPVLSL